MKRLVILIACALPAIPTESISQSGAWGAVVIYYDHPNSAYGLAWNYSSAGEAVSAAVDECNKQAGCNYREAHPIVFSTSIPKEDDYYAGAEVSTNYGRLSIDLRASRCVAIILFRVDDGYANPYDAGIW